MSPILNLTFIPLFAEIETLVQDKTSFYGYGFYGIQFLGTLFFRVLVSWGIIYPLNMITP